MRLRASGSSEPLLDDYLGSDQAEGAATPGAFELQAREALGLPLSQQHYQASSQVCGVDAFRHTSTQLPSVARGSGHDSGPVQTLVLILTERPSSPRIHLRTPLGSRSRGVRSDDFSN